MGAVVNSRADNGTDRQLRLIHSESDTPKMGLKSQYWRLLLMYTME